MSSKISISHTATTQSKVSIQPVALEAPEILEAANPCPGSQINVALLRQVAQLIQRESNRFAMSRWFADATGEGKKFKGGPSCNTAACICGHALLLEGYQYARREDCFLPLTLARKDGIEYDNMFSLGAEVLGLTREQAFKLFHVRYWPALFKDPVVQGRILEQTPEYAANAIARIEHFIATCGRE